MSGHGFSAVNGPKSFAASPASLARRREPGRRLLGPICISRPRKIQTRTHTKRRLSREMTRFLEDAHCI